MIEMEILFNGVKRNVKNFFEDIAKLIFEEEIEGKVEIEVDNDYLKGEISYEVIKKDDTFFVKLIHDRVEIFGDPNLFYKKMDCRFLTAVDIEKNQYKFYKLELNFDNLRVLATYGRISNYNEARIATYPFSMFWVKYFEKAQKGYKDRTELFLKDELLQNKKEEKSMEESEKSIDEASLLFKRLAEMARKAVRNAKISVKITKEIVRESNKLFEKLKLVKNYFEYKETYLELITILQRPINNVKDYILTEDSFSVETLREVVQREENILNAIKGVYFFDSPKGNDGGSFLNKKIKCFLATDKQREDVVKRLSDNLQSKVKNVYRIIPSEQKKLFDQYLEENKIKKVKMFWHGSRNENWSNIVNTSLQLNPNAIITGKMFGDGIYFAPSSEKSWGYTSGMGSYWARGRENTSFMGLYATAYGDPLTIDTFTRIDYKQMVENSSKNCLHVKGGVSLRNDEVVFYDERAVLLSYLVEFKT